MEYRVVADHKDDNKKPLRRDKPPTQGFSYLLEEVL
jgi:hypothetical protein